MRGASQESVVQKHEAMHAFGLGYFRGRVRVEMLRRFEVSINGRRKTWIKGYSSFTLADWMTPRHFL